MTDRAGTAARTGNLSELQDRFVAAAGAEAGCRRRLDLRDHPMPDWVRRYPYALQPWPSFVAGEVLEQVRRLPVELARLIAEIPDRLFDRDPGRIDRYYGLGGAEAARSMLSGGIGPASLLSRVDLIQDTEGLRCLEVNMSAQIGGWQPRFWAATCLDSACVRRFLEAAGVDRRALVYRDPLSVLFEHVVGEVLERRADGGSGSGAVHLVLIVSRAFWGGDSAAVLEHMGALYRQFLAAHHPGLEGTLEGCHYEELAVRQGRVWLGGHPVDAVLEYHWDGYTHPEVARCAAAGAVRLYNGLQTHVLNDKRNLALLSECAGSGVYDAAERELIERHVPWTRCVSEGFTEFRGERSYLPELVVERRSELVLKEARSARGANVLCGWTVPPEAWEQGIERALAEGTWIVQERVQPLPHEYQSGEEGSAAHDVVWGLFSFGRRFGGGFLRMLPTGRSGVINSARGATEGIFYELEDLEAAAREDA